MSAVRSLAAVPTLPLRAAIYTRISLDATGEAAGVQLQEQLCRELCEREGWDVADVYVDNDISAFSGKRRPEYERLMAAVEHGDVEAIVTYNSDRLYRRLKDLVELTSVVQRARARIRTVTSGEVELNTADGVFNAQVLGAAAEHQSRRTGERVKMRHRANAEKGKAHGGARPFGYKRVKDKPGELAVVPDEAELIREATATILRGASLNSIVIGWNARGVPTVNGGTWRPNALSKMLRAGRIAGLREVDGEVIGPGTWEPIIDREQWERLRSRIIHAPVGRRPLRALLAGMVVCGVCGVRMRAMSSGNPDAPSPNAKYRGRAYACEKTGGTGSQRPCGSNSVKAEAVEQLVVDHVLAALEGVNLAAERARRTVRSSAHLVSEISADEQLLTDLAADMGARRMSRAEWLSAREPIEARLEENRRALTQVAADSELDDAAFEGLDGERWEGLTLDQRRAVIRLFVSQITVAKGRPGRTFDPGRVTIVPAASGRS